MTTLLMIFLGTGALTTLLAVPLMRRWIRPNGWYGFRFPSAFRSAEVWYAVNAYGGRYLFVTGILFTLAALALYYVPGLSLDGYALSALAVLVVTMGITVVQSVRYSRRLPG
jgi:hypothetical protein